MANELRTRDGLPFNFVDGLRIKGVDVTNWEKIFIDQGASYVGFTPVGNLAATNVQAAIAELESEKQSKSEPIANATTAVNLRPGANQGIVWDNDAFGGTQDTASITLETASGEATKMRFKMTNDSDDNFEFTAKTADGLTSFNNAMTLNGNVLLNAANYVDYTAPMIADYVALRAYAGNATQVRITSNGIAGFFYYDSADSTSVDNGGTIIVAADGRRFKRDYVGELNVAWFEAACDGETDDWPAIQAANEYLKANGGGTLYFPGWCLINQPFYHYGSVDGGWSIAYPSPNQAKITWKSNGQGGIKVGSGITSGDVIRLSKPSTSTALNYMVGFSNFAIDCSGKNVTALNGFSYSGIYGANHIVSVDGLYINGIQGADAIGIDFGTITDSEIHRLRVQGYGTGPYAGVRLNKANIQLHSYTATFCKHSIVVGSLTEACIQMFGGALLAPKQSHIHWESASADYKSSASVIVGAFIGETNTTPTTTQGPIMSCASPNNLDIGVITFIGCGFDNWTGSTNMINIDWGGRFNFIGCNAWSAATGNKSIKFGQYCYALMFNNKEIAVDTSGAGAIAGQVQGNLQAEAVAFTPALAATGSTFSYSSRNGYYTRVGNLVTVSIRIQLNATGNTFTGNALTITGLPFPISDKTFSHTAVPAEWFSTATPMTGVTGLLVQNSSTLAMYKKTAATTSSFATTLLDTDIGATSGGGLYVSFAYQVAPGY